MKILSVVGARPNFMKIAPFIEAIKHHNKSVSLEKIEHILVHTGQHYDNRMSDNFFEALGIPFPDINLEVGSGSHAFQVGHTMIAFEKVLHQYKPDWVVLVGDVNATLACSVTAKKENTKCCHIEAGLRSGDLSMPEEINRLVTDRLSDLLLTPDPISTQNLINESVPANRIKFVGNIMIDTLETHRSRAQKLELEDIIRENLLEDSRNWPSVNPDKLAIITIHRPSNVDNKEILEQLLEFISKEVTKELTVIWPIHPRTSAKIKEFGLWENLRNTSNLILLNPIGYHEMLRLNMLAQIMLTDSGGLQEECCVLGTPCLTLRWNTERPITLREFGGASILVGNNIERLKHEFYETLLQSRKPMRPELWDGQTATRCLDAILNYNEK